MGNLIDNKFKPILTSFPQQFQSLGTIQHPKFPPNCTLYKHQSNKLVVQIKLTQNLLALIQLDYQTDHPKIITCLGYNKSVCYYEYLPSSLYSNLELKIQLNQNYQEAEIWYILYQIFDALNYLHSKSQPIGDISLDSILMDRNGKVKLLNNFKCEIDKRYWKQELKYIDPTLIKQLEQQQKKLTTEQIQENDIFSVSIIMGELLTLNVFSKEIRITNIEQILSNLNYSKQLLSIIAILTFPFDQRPTAQDIFEILDLYSQQILYFQPLKLSQNDLLKLNFAQKYFHQKLLNSRLIYYPQRVQTNQSFK